MTSPRAAMRTTLGTFTPFGARVFGARGRHTQTQRRQVISAGGNSYEATGYDFMRNGIKLWFAAWGDRRDDWYIRDKVRRPPTQRELVNARQIIYGVEKPNGVVEFKSHSGGLDV